MLGKNQSALMGAMNLKQLADRLGLSQTTVSRALNGYPEVSEATRLRVVDAARRLNYHPSARARSLAIGKSMAIGHVVPMSAQHEVINPIFADFISGLGEVYRESGYDMLVNVVESADQTKAYRDLAARRSVDGFIVQGPLVEDPRIELLQQIGLPFVIHGRSSGSMTDGCSWVDINNRRSFERATRHLVDLGHRRIGLINGLEKMDFAYRRRQGYLSSLQDHKIALDDDLMESSEMTEVFGYEAARRMLSLSDPATAFVTSSMVLAIGCRRAVQNAGLELGRDISLITHDDDLSYFQNAGGLPIFTALKSSVRQAGRLCAATLIGLIENPNSGPVHQLLEADFILGPSSGPKR